MDTLIATIALCAAFSLGLFFGHLWAKHQTRGIRADRDRWVKLAAATAARNAELEWFDGPLAKALIEVEGEPTCSECGMTLARYAGPGDERGWTCVRCDGGES
jgi:hypothetical protein